MTAKELMEYEVENTGFQLTRCLQDLPADLLDKRLTEKGMSPRETASHLCESYLALDAHNKGRHYEWGSFSAEALAWDRLLAKMFELRKEAAAGTCVDEDDKLRACHDYIVAHDAYHVGQLCQLRLQFQPDWEPYSIYSF